MIFAGTYPDGGVFRSSDNGESWTAVNSGLTCKNIWSLAINSGRRHFCRDGWLWERASFDRPTKAIIGPWLTMD